MVGLAESPYARADYPHEGRMVLCAVEEVGHVEDEQGEVVCGIDARVYIPQEPLVVVHQPLLERRARLQAVSCTGIAWSQEVRVRGVDIVALVELALQPRHSDEDGEILPHITAA